MTGLENRVTELERKVDAFRDDMNWVKNALRTIAGAIGITVQ